MMATKTPVALFTYNRPSHTRRALEALSKCSRIEECEFYFFSDGPRTKNARPQVDTTRKILKEWEGCFNATIIQRNSNQGLGVSKFNRFRCDRAMRTIRACHCVGG